MTLTVGILGLGKIGTVLKQLLEENNVIQIGESVDVKVLRINISEYNDEDE